MKNLFFACFLLFSGLLSCIAQTGRYDSTIFSAVTVTANVVFANALQLNSPYNDESNTTNVDIVMDIHQPVGDTCTNRRAIIFVHGGAFVSGNKNHDDMVAFCDTFALKGYVTATIEYRLGMNTNDGSSCTRAVYRGLQDGRSAVRFLRANASTYGIDSSKVYMAGSSAGGFITLHTIYMDDVSEKPAEAGSYTYQNPYYPYNTITAPDLGGYDIGNYLTSNGQPDVIMSLWGAVKDTVLITADDIAPVFLVHGTADNIVPFNVGSPFNYPSFPPTYGSNPIYQRLTNLNLTQKESYFVPNEGHEFYGVTNGNWDNGTGGNAYWDTVVLKTTVFFANQGRATVSTSAITNISYSSATSGGNVTDEGESPVSAKGVCWSISANPTIFNSHTTDGTGTGSFTSSITGLSGGGQAYYVRAYATNSEGTAYGEQKEFVTNMIPPGNALDFDGSDDYVQLSQNSGLPIYNNGTGNAYSVCLWVKGNAQNDKKIFCEGNNTGNNPLFAIGTNTNGKVELYIQTDNNTNILSVSSTTTAFDGIWHHVAWVDNNGTATLYIDGQADAANFSYTRSTLTLDISAIGVMLRSSPSNYFAGRIDEVSIWNAARSQADIRSTMHKVLNGDETNLVAYYRFDYNSGTLLSDLTSNENNGMLHNMDDTDWVTSTAPMPFVTIGNGNWESNSTWATGQNAPVNPWSRVKIENNVTLNSNIEVIELEIGNSAILTISTGDTLTVGGQ